jgi:PelA/Pel-15E family pectate lyase
MKNLTCTFAMLVLSITATAQKVVGVTPVIIDLWPNGAPNNNELVGEEYRNKDNRITNVTHPTLTVFQATNPNGMAVIACPGGGYQHLAFEHEGTDFADWYNSQGITLAVLKYRMPNGHFECPQSDIQQAMSLMHQHAKEWGVDENKIGVQGASAGGHLAATLATNYRNILERPAFQIMFYGAITPKMAQQKTEESSTKSKLAFQGNLLKVTNDTPPAFIMVSADDHLCCDLCIDYFKALKDAGVWSCLHVYPEGTHGWGFKDAFKYKPMWTMELSFWLNELNRKLNTQIYQHKKEFTVSHYPLFETNKKFFLTDEAKRIGDQILAYQRCTGGWPKNIDMTSPMTNDEIEKVKKDKNRRDDSTIDNNATNMQMTYLARLFQQTNDIRYKDAFRQGVEYLLSGQYANGGWPQFWPEMHGYQTDITYNDNAMVNTLELFRKLIEQETPYDNNLIDQTLRNKIKVAFGKGIKCILNTQIIVNKEPTVWCQQYDRETLKPASARAFELASFCSQESASIVKLLMQLPNPDKRIKHAIRGAMKWFDTYKLTGLRIERTGDRDGERNVRLIADSKATPIWARYYDFTFCEPFVCDRDGIPRRKLEEIGVERRTGYAWYGTHATELYPLYEAWANKYDKNNKLNISLNTKGANENGRIQMDRKAIINKKLFDVIVKPNESIQAAICKAPEKPQKPFKILILKGVYNQKVIIDRPNIILVGEDRNTTKIILAETAKTKKINEYDKKEVGNGVIVLQDGADDCVISGLTVYNNYGTTIENTTTHQMAIFGRATHTIIINCNIMSDGNDALALWAPNGNGMYYHADLSVTSPGVDFLCPRGWCFATRCNFTGNSRAIIWHDGRGDKSKKLVITDSKFDAKAPTILGRYHHDSQFYLLHCTFSNQILDSNITYAYSDKVIDKCPWGQRVYFYDCHREGGHGAWMNNNLNNSTEKPSFYAITASWTFGGKWDPEQRIRNLWNILNY